MKKQQNKNGLLPLSLMTAGLLAPVLQKKAGLNVRLIRNWAEIVGQAVAAAAVPVKISWPRQADKAGRGDFAAAVLVIACFGYEAVKLQHETSEIIARINRFFGYRAIGKIRIEQRWPQQERNAAAAVSAPGGARSWAGAAAGAAVPDSLQADINAIADKALRASLRRLGQAVYRA